ncbi:CocE/NonD family hydrolase [Mycolicibacter sp. MYC123]|uniref:CocE/NonD family hydrolase n=1 Tax=[Mycobacterium] zoologicum TaxID=2872311 RepID=A0ABU5YSM1_9MYCO|nr:CocE/NonD family hydrolase [Mycolicibacter sp. MYC123]MEB3051944.1 CocE/NonD family hydrolase [Mycolicibacter sp. MYC123]
MSSPRRTDVILNRVLRQLPPPTTGYTVRRERIPMRDDVVLLADHYQPTGDIRGTLLVRCPYGRGFPFAPVFGRMYAARGYRVILQSVRGTFGSGGEFEPMVNEAADGADTVAWMRTQPWFTGSFGTIGLSYLGFTQWALLADPPPELAAAVITVGPHDLHQSTWGVGSFALNDFLGWSHLMAHQEDRPRLRAGLHQLTAQRRVGRAAARRPLGAAGRALLGTGSPWYESWVEHPEADDPFWNALRHPEALKRSEVPVLLLGGWQDLFLDQTLDQYRALRDRDVEVAMTIGPWTHTQMLTSGLSRVTSESLQWLDTHLAGVETVPRPSRVRVYSAGRGWQDRPDWAPADAVDAWYLQPGGALSQIAPAPASATFRFDPTDPPPTIGGRLLSAAGGYRNDSMLARRDDMLNFTSAALTRDLDVCGVPVVELEHSADNDDVDVFVRVSEVNPRGRSVNVTEGYRRLHRHTGPVRIELDAVARRFAAGSRIRVVIGGGNHPRYAVNLGTGEAPISGSRTQPAVHTVAFGESRLLLPVEH